MKHSTSRSTTRSKPSLTSKKELFPPTSNMKVVDRTPDTAKPSSISRLRANDGIVAATKRRESVRNAQEEPEYVRLMIINVPITEKMRMVGALF